MSTDDDMPDLIAMLDQARAGMQQMAELLFSYHQALVAHGFDAGEAMRLVADYQMHLLTSAGSE